MQYTLRSIDPHETTLSVESWLHPRRGTAYVEIDLTGAFDTAARCLLPSEARDVARALMEAADRAEALETQA